MATENPMEEMIISVSLCIIITSIFIACYLLFK